MYRLISTFGVLTRARCFFTIIPGPLIAGVMLLIWLKLPAVPRRRKTGFELIKTFDPLGTMFFLVSIFCLLLALQWAGLSYAWFDPRIILLFIMFGVSPALLK